MTAESDTRARLIEGAIATLRSHGIAGVSARTIAKTAGVNQALVFYHFGSVNDLISQACRENTTARVDRYRSQFAGVESLNELLSLGRLVHDTERRAGNVTVLAQVLAGAQQDEHLAAAARDALGIWIQELRTVVDRVIDKSVLSGLVDTASMTQALAASFIGMELYDGISDGSNDLFGALEPLAAIADMADDLGTISKKAVRSRVRHAVKKRHNK